MTIETLIANMIETKLSEIKFIDEQIANIKPRDMSKEYYEMRRIELVGELDGIYKVKKVLGRWFDLAGISIKRGETNGKDG